MRIVSLEPSVTAMLFALGAQEHLVAVSEYCHRLVDIGQRPQLAPTWSAQADELAKLAPDLVVVASPYRSESIAALLQAGLNLFCLYPQQLSDLYQHLIWLGGLTGRADKAKEVVARIQADFEAIQGRVKASAARYRPRVYVEMWPQPMMSSSPWVAELVELAGGQFVPARPGRKVTDEEIIAADPEIIVVAWAGVVDPPLSKVTGRASWAEMTAIAQNRIVAVEEIHLNAPGPNLVEGAKQLAQVIHPRELFYDHS